MIGRLGRRYGPPVAAFASFILVWEAIVRLEHIQPFVLPAPSLVAMTLITDRTTLFASLWVTLRTTFAALALAIAGGSLLAVLFSQWKWLERALLPFAVILQVTPIIAIAPLLLIYFAPWQAVLACAFLVAFFPILANCSLGLASADRNLADLFLLYGASRWQTLLMLKLPAALPYFFAGLRIGGGLALIGAIVAELAAGAAGQETGLAFRIVEAGYRLEIPRMFAALTLISLTGIAIFFTLSGLSRFALRHWPDSADV
jgi:NitT/TauT family transport system permease protein